MKPFYKIEEYVYMDLSFRMSTNTMANILYAGIETNARFTTLYNMSRGEYTRKQNAYNMAHIKVHIHPDAIFLFEELSTLKLKTPPVIGIN